MKRIKHKLITLFILLFCLVANLQAQQEITGKVVKILDGDTFDILLSDYSTERIRLADIDAPEKNQDFGKVSKQYLISLIATKEVTVEFKSRDRNKRIIGTVYEGKNLINMSMVQAGLAWHFVKYSKDQRFAQAQNVARKQKKGLWIQSNALPPWDFRKIKHKN